MPAFVLAMVPWLVGAVLTALLTYLLSDYLLVVLKHIFIFFMIASESVLRYVYLEVSDSLEAFLFSLFGRHSTLALFLQQIGLVDALLLFIYIRMFISRFYS